MSAYRRRFRDPETGKSVVDPQWRYRVTITMPDGSRQRITGTPDLNTKAAAEEAERRHIQRAQNPAKVKDSSTFGAFVDDKWWPTVVNRKSTVEAKEVHVRLHLKPALGSLRLAEIDAEVLAKLVKSLTDARQSEKSVRNIMSTLHKALTDAVAWRYLVALPAFPKVKVPETEWDHLTLAEVDQLLAAARDDRDRLILSFLARTGARAGELLAVEWGDIDWRGKPTIKIQRSRTRGEVGAPKSGRARTIPLASTLQAQLRAFQPVPAKGLIFHDGDGGPLRIGQLHECLWRTLKAAELRDIRLHDLRHTFGSNLAAKGVPIPQIQKWMGHSTITMTMRYVQFAPDGNRDLIEALG